MYVRYSVKVPILNVGSTKAGYLDSCMGQAGAQLLWVIGQPCWLEVPCRTKTTIKVKGYCAGRLGQTLIGRHVIIELKWLTDIPVGQSAYK